MPLESPRKAGELASCAAIEGGGPAGGGPGNNGPLGKANIPAAPGCVSGCTGRRGMPGHSGGAKGDKGKDNPGATENGRATARDACPALAGGTLATLVLGDCGVPAVDGAPSHWLVCAPFAGTNLGVSGTANCLFVEGPILEAICAPWLAPSDSGWTNRWLSLRRNSTSKHVRRLSGVCCDCVLTFIGMMMTLLSGTQVSSPLLSFAIDAPGSFRPVPFEDESTMANPIEPLSPPLPEINSSACIFDIPGRETTISFLGLLPMRTTFFDPGCSVYV